jgi:hypothetical protein
MKTALYVARIIHHDLVYANASAWQWWRAVGTGNYKDGLIYAHPDKSLIDGSFTDSKLMWVLGNYSRFIRPGAIRLGIIAYNTQGKIIPEGDTDPFSLMISAYLNKNNKPVAVVINYGDKERTFELNWKGNAPVEWQPYCTSDEKDFNLQPMSKIKYGKEIKIPARSVVTYLGEK